jgi:hypothetical protein
MARFQLVTSHVFGAVKLKAGTKIADSAGAAQPGDVVITSLSSATVSPEMTALDASATTMKNGSRFAGVPDRTFVTGAESIG